MTTLRYFESIKLPTEFDESSITSGYSGKPLQPIVTEFKSFLIKWFNRYGKVIRSKVTLSKLVSHEASYRFKSGPMGPSILSSHLCAMAIYNNKELLNIYEEYCKITVSVDIMKQFYNCINLCIENVGNRYLLITGKISLASEPAGKTRLFAICNFWVQTVLKPLHDCLMETLKLFRSDGTFDQIKQFNRILQESEGQKTYCFDLSKATDRFPIILQQVLLEVIVNKKFAKT
jgi:hypothetical protein